jgi:VIT1/CCC1 family predicted Fe2+/Mn2+ transporter
MPATPHIERHFTGNETIRDIVIGMSDGLTVPFALAAGLSGATDASTIVVTAGLAEIAAGSIAMGLGGFLAAKGDSEHYFNERKREEWEILNKTDVEETEVAEIMESFGLNSVESAVVVKALKRKPDKWVDFMMDAELHLDKPDPKRALSSALTIGGSYIAGGIIPLSAYLFIHSAHNALIYSVGMTLVALFIFGFLKGHFTGVARLRSALQTLVVGGLAAGAAFGLAKLISP